MGYQLPERLPGQVMQPSKLLLINGGSAVRLDLVSAVKARFYSWECDHLTVTSLHEVGVDNLFCYDIVFFSGQLADARDLAWLENFRVAACHPELPLLILFSEQAETIRSGLLSGVSLSLSQDISMVKFAVELDKVIELERVFRCYPIVLDGWHLLEVLHDSEHAVIFLAENNAAERAVIKRYKFDVADFSEAQSEKLLQSFMVLQANEDSSVVNLIDAGIWDGAVYCIMEYLQGVTLRCVLDDDELSLSWRLSCFASIARALDGLHKANMVHGDLKASNIWIREDLTPVLIDVGLESQWLADAGFIEPEEVYGTPYYISPERIAGGPADVSSDLYALGVLFYEMLTGEKPYVADSLTQLLYLHIFEPVPRLTGELAAYQSLLSLLMAKSPELRLQSSQEVSDFLDIPTRQ